MPKSRPKQPSLDSIRTRMQDAVAASGLTYEEVGLAMGLSKTIARRRVQTLLTSQSVRFNPSLLTLLSFAQAVHKPLRSFMD
jgi:hypothetical protein